MRAGIATFAMIVALVVWPAALIAQSASKPSLKMSASGLVFATAITAAELSMLLRGGRKVLVFDTRERDEFKVSWIPGAMRLDPTAQTEVVVGRVRRRAKGAVLVYYCTAMSRSARIAEWAAEDLKALGADAVYVLKNGIIGWANAGLPLVNRNGPTDFLHPYDRSLVRHLKRPELARFQLPVAE